MVEDVCAVLWGLAEMRIREELCLGRPFRTSRRRSTDTGKNSRRKGKKDGHQHPCSHIGFRV